MWEHVGYESTFMIAFHLKVDVLQYGGVRVEVRTELLRLRSTCVGVHVAASLMSHDHAMSATAEP